MNWVKEKWSHIFRYDYLKGKTVTYSYYARSSWIWFKIMRGTGLDDTFWRKALLVLASVASVVTLSLAGDWGEVLYACILCGLTLLQIISNRLGPMFNGRRKSNWFELLFVISLLAGCVYSWGTYLGYLCMGYLLSIIYSHIPSYEMIVSRLNVEVAVVYEIAQVANRYVIEEIVLSEEAQALALQHCQHIAAREFLASQPGLQFAPTVALANDIAQLTKDTVNLQTEEIIHRCSVDIDYVGRILDRDF